MKLLLPLVFATFSSVYALDYATFEKPPRAHYPETWFHIIGGNAAQAGMKDDLTAIKAAGIQGIQFFHGQFGGTWPGVTKPIPCLSAAWDNLVAYTADECARQGLTFKMQNCPGWSMSGGPWITPANAMRRIVCGRNDFVTDATGCIKGTLAKARRLNFGRATRPEEIDYRDICVLAFPTPKDAGEAALVPEHVMDEGIESRIYTFAKPVTLRTVTFPPYDSLDRKHIYEPHLHLKVEAQDGGGNWRCVAAEDYPCGNWMSGWSEAPRFSMALDETTARIWRVTARRRTECAFPEPRFHAAAHLDNWESLAGWTYRALVPRAYPKQDAAAYVPLHAVVDVTAACAADGSFTWQPPKPGAWTILRLGHVNLGTVNAPAPKEGTGWECSKFDREGAEAHFAGYIGRLAQGPLKGKPFAGIVIDSWECGRQSWGRTLEADFRAHAGYDVRPWLPALFGWVITDVAATDGFLRDWRRVCGHLIEERYYRRMAELAHAHGMTAQFETAFGDVIHGDLLRFWKYSDTVMCEFWQPHDDPSDKGGVGSYNYKPIRPAVAAAHVYGKRRVAAEAFTSFTLTWNENFRLLKGVADKHFARGVTHCIFHTYTHNPLPGRTLNPGSPFGSNIGTPFLRNQTWWQFMPELTTYLARCGALLESGLPVVDVLWVLGDGYGHHPDEKAAFPAGYQYDYINTDALMTRLAVNDGRLAFPDGFTARVLWVPPDTYLAEKTQAKLAALERAGACVVRGNVQVLAQTLAACKITPDALLTQGAAPVLDDFAWYHRQTDTQDIYFVSTAKKGGLTGEVTFRARGGAEVWNPVTGKRWPACVRRRSAATTTVALDLPEEGSCFVVFTRTAPNTAVTQQATYVTEQPLDGLWRIDFPYGSETPTAVTVSKLVPWKDLFDGARKDNSSRARAYSGKATYTTSFVWRPAVKPARVTLDLGNVEAWAEVALNGHPLGTCWCKPYAVEVTPFLKEGRNELTVAVTSTWHNKLLYYAHVPIAERYTWTTFYPDLREDYLPAGLLGPVCLRLETQAALRVGTYNIRLSPGDRKTPNAWDLRKKDLVAQIKNLNLDVFGLQEVCPDQAQYLANALPAYAFVGEHREKDRVSGEASPVCYRRDRFTALKSGTFWLSETPEVPASKSWNTRCTRVCSWLLLEDRHTGKRFTFANTHTDHISAEAREKGMLLIISRMKEFGAGVPIVFTGDHNCPEVDQPAQAVAKILTNALYATQTPPAGPWRTFNGWHYRATETTIGEALQKTVRERNGDKAFGPRIDYIYVSPGVTVRDYATHSTVRPNTTTYPSDHFPCTATIEL